jgi:hypothetical protein
MADAPKKAKTNKGQRATARKPASAWFGPGG